MENQPEKQDQIPEKKIKIINKKPLEKKSK